MVLSESADLPAIMGGSPIFPGGLPVARPSVPDAGRVTADIQRILESGMLTNGPYVRELEARAADYLGVRHCVAVASCTAGLMLVLRASDLTGDVVIPSFTFAATAHAVAWNGLRPVFADVDRESLTLSASEAARAAGVRTSAILATHTFGTPCDVEGLTQAARAAGVRLFFDAAHAFGTRRDGVSAGGWGDAEVFSLTPTKLVVAGEGGIIATNDDLLAERCRIGRDYANPGDYDCLFVGLNARMSEFHAAIGLASLEGLEARVGSRNEIARAYRDGLGQIPGITFPRVCDQDRSTFKDFVILVEPESFGMDAIKLGLALKAEGIDTRRYYTPPIHRMKAYRGLNGHRLPATEWAADRVLTLPLWSEMSAADQRGVTSAIHRIQRTAQTGR